MASDAAIAHDAVAGGAVGMAAETRASAPKLAGGGKLAVAALAPVECTATVGLSAYEVRGGREGASFERDQGEEVYESFGVSHVDKSALSNVSDIRSRA